MQCKKFRYTIQSIGESLKWVFDSIFLAKYYSQVFLTASVDPSIVIPKILTRIYVGKFPRPQSCRGRTVILLALFFAIRIRALVYPKAQLFFLGCFHILWNEMALLAQAIWRNKNNQLMMGVDRSFCENEGRMLTKRLL